MNIDDMNDNAETGHLSTPALSVVILTPDNFETIRKTVTALRAQNICSQMELLIVATAESRLQLSVDEIDGFHSARVIALPESSAPETSVGQAYACGVLAARAPLVAFAEDHSFPDSGWAQALVEAHRKEYAAVGPCIANANPGTATSWANLLIEYGDWIGRAEAREMIHVPGHNSCYKREVLLTCGAELAEFLESESLLHWHLRHHGHSFFLEPRAVTRHTNFSTWPSSAWLRFNSGRNFAATRAREWPRWRCLIYALAAPLIPCVRLSRVVPNWSRARRQYAMPRAVLPVMWLGLILDGCGELVGYLSGAGSAVQFLWDIESHRERFALP